MGLSVTLGMWCGWRGSGSTDLFPVLPDISNTLRLERNRSDSHEVTTREPFGTLPVNSEQCGTTLANFQPTLQPNVVPPTGTSLFCPMRRCPAPARPAPRRVPISSEYDGPLNTESFVSMGPRIVTIFFRIASRIAGVRLVFIVRFAGYPVQTVRPAKLPALIHPNYALLASSKPPPRRSQKGWRTETVTTTRFLDVFSRQLLPLSYLEVR